MADKTKAELEKEAKDAGVQLESGDTKAEIEDKLEAKEQGNLPDVYVARFKPAERRAEGVEAKKAAIAARKAAENGPDKSAGAGPGTAAPSAAR